MGILTFVATAAAALQPQPAVAIGTQHRLIEGVASDGRTIYVSSVIDGTVLACRKTCRPFAKLPEPLRPLGMAWDDSRKRLWIAADCPPFPNFPKCDRGALVALDRSGRIRARLAPARGSFHSGDVAAERGNVFVGDALNGAIYWLKPGAGRLTTLLAPGIGRSAQGMALEPAGTSLIVADYGRGVARIDLGSGERRLLPTEDGTPLRGIDGLLRCRGRYLAVFNGAQPNKLYSISVADSLIRVEELYTGPALPAPTQLALHGRSVLVAGDGDWDKALKEGVVPHGPHPIQAIPLAEACPGYRTSK